MIQRLLQTDNDYLYFFLRIVAGIIIFPYGMQKLFGWGINRSLKQITEKGIPVFIAWLVIIGQSLGALALITGFLARIAAAGNFIIFTGALVTHFPNGWFMNWFGKKNGEGIEYFIMLLSMLLVVIINGSGAISIDRWLWARR
ncbi:MAG: hypothetical protein JWM28_296 [Chitinophagaceae bacterium]|nr:hypothetical protein [Chitinophagaceae bacterium]